MKIIKSEYIRFRLSRRERQIIEQINEIDLTTISEHIRRALSFYAKNAHINIFKNQKEASNEN